MVARCRGAQFVGVWHTRKVDTNSSLKNGPWWVDDVYKGNYKQVW